MKYTVFIILTFVLFPFHVFADKAEYIFIIDEKSQPLMGYLVLSTQKDDIFLGKTDPLKKWIINTKSQLFLIKDGFLYKIKDSIIVDRRKDLVLYIVDFSVSKPLYFQPQESPIDKDVTSLKENKAFVYSKLKKIQSLSDEKQGISSYQSDKDILSLAIQNEITGQLDKALTLYEEILKRQPQNNEIIEKVATLNYRLGNFKKSKEYLLKLPQNQETIIKISSILIMEKNYKEVLNLLQKPNIKNLPYFQYVRGIVYYLVGNRQEAYKEVVELSKSNPELSKSLRNLIR